MSKNKTECPECGNRKEVWTNGSGEIQCDNCGYDETLEKDE